MADVARQLKISQATVSYVLSGRKSGTVSEATRERVLEMARQMGYQPNRAAQALAGGGLPIIELSVMGFFPSFYSHVLEAFSEELYPTEYELHIVDSIASGKSNQSKSYWPVAGIITDISLSDDRLTALQRRGCPVISVGPYARTEIDHVKVEFASALQKGLRHLMEGCRRVAFVSLWSPANSEEDLRYYAYRQLVEEIGIEEEVILAPRSGVPSLRYETRNKVKQYIAKSGCPDAFFCFNDERAIATLAALRDLGIRVPQDVRLLGCDGIEETEYQFPTISTIQYPFQEVARRAWEFLQHRIEYPDGPIQSAIITPELLIRESSMR
jgi:LacI family transcriptional regulator